MASIIREQKRDIYKKVFLSDGQVQHELVQTINNKWTIVIYNDRDDIISITKNDGLTRTYRVNLEKDFAIKISKTCIGSMFGAKSLFDVFVNVIDNTNFRLKFLEKIWDYTIPIKII
jgi:hypothetical protein